MKLYVLLVGHEEERLFEDFHRGFFLLELKLGLIAESCLNPGFSTMIANIFAMRSDTEVRRDLSGNFSMK